MDKILGSKENMDTDNMTLVTHAAVGQIPGSAPRIFTTLILKSERTEEITISNSSGDTAVLGSEAPEMLHSSEVPNILNGSETTNILHSSEAPNILHTDEATSILHSSEPHALHTHISPNVSNVLTQIDTKYNPTVPTTFITNTPRTVPTTFITNTPRTVQTTFITNTPRTIPTTFITNTPSNLHINSSAEANLTLQIESVNTLARNIQTGGETVQSISHGMHESHIVRNVDVLTERTSGNLATSEIMTSDTVVDADVAETIILITQNNGVTLPSDVNQL